MIAYILEAQLTVLYDVVVAAHAVPLVPVLAQVLFPG
jgi:hypothetical protein